MMVPFHKLFSFADPWDTLFMVVGTLGAIGCGLTQPLMSLIAGDLVQALGNSQSNNVVSAVSMVSLRFVYLPIGCGVAAFLQVVCWTVTGERQAARITCKVTLKVDACRFVYGSATKDHSLWKVHCDILNGC